jgi:hypothetical protein
MTHGNTTNDLLLDAAVNGNEHGVRSALAQGADVNAENDYGRTAFLCALTGQRCVCAIREYSHTLSDS